jgi:hypothetical protein
MFRREFLGAPGSRWESWERQALAWPAPVTVPLEVFGGEGVSQVRDGAL